MIGRLFLIFSIAAFGFSAHGDEADDALAKLTLKNHSFFAKRGTKQADFLDRLYSRLPVNPSDDDCLRYFFSEPLSEGEMAKVSNIEMQLRLEAVVRSRLDHTREVNGKTVNGLEEFRERLKQVRVLEIEIKNGWIAPEMGRKKRDKQLGKIREFLFQFQKDDPDFGVAEYSILLGTDPAHIPLMDRIMRLEMLSRCQKKHRLDSERSAFVRSYYRYLNSLTRPSQENLKHFFGIPAFGRSYNSDIRFLNASLHKTILKASEDFNSIAVWDFLIQPTY
jgi:hypothetical protein